jgi:thioredoxin-related protein
MKKLAIVFVLLITVFASKATTTDTTHLYDPKANAEADIAKAIAQAKKENKHVFIQAGGNWCIWCLRFNNFINSTPTLDSMVKADYVVYHLNYSKENKNEAVMAKYGFPQRFGFPVFIILDGDGNRIHTQNSAYLEQNNWYSKEKVTEFLRNWRPAALNPANYKAE